MKISKQLNLSTELCKLLTIILFFSIGTIQFLGFSTAYVFSTYNAVGTLLYLSFAFSLSFLGYWLSVFMLNKHKKSNGLLIKSSLVLIFICCFLATFSKSNLLTVFYLSFGSFFSGFGWAERHFLEKIHAKDSHKDIYLSLLQSFIVLLKIIFPLFITLIFFSDINKHFILNVGFVNLIFGLLLPKMPNHNIEETHFFSLKEILSIVKKQPTQYNNYYLTEGGTSILKQSLFVIGTIAILKSVSNYAYTETIASVFSGIMMFWLSKHTVTKGLGQIARLNAAMILLSLTWISLILSFYYHFFFYIFVISFSLGLPLITAFKHSMILGIVNSSQQSPFITSLYREVILLISRVIFCLFCAFLIYFVTNQQLSTQILCFILLISIPLEYYYCIKIIRK